jgi:DNA modification methylase
MLLHGDCLERLRELPACSVDACVTDPPYGLSFMGKKWDYDVPGEDIWRECLRVLKPGGHLLAFAGTRTQHRMAVRIEDAGFEIRDMIAWVYGSGFPKSLDVGKAIDKCNGETGRLLKFTEWMRTTGLTARQVDKITGTNMGGHYLTAASQPAIPTPALWTLLRPHCGDVPEWVDQLVERVEAEREVVGTKEWSNSASHFVPGEDHSQRVRLDITAPATPEAQQWAGWGTALKPALEPITVARKPFKGNVAANVLEHGTGALNIDSCRVGTEPVKLNSYKSHGAEGCTTLAEGGTHKGESYMSRESLGRWPANLIHDGSDEVVGLFPYQRNGGANVALTRKAGTATNIMSGTGMSRPTNAAYAGDSGSAARFFYCAKASKADRNEGNTHPTVKPTDLMRYLCRLVTPPGGIVLDPFMGSGSTGKAAMLDGFRFIGIEREAEYLEIAKQRMQQPAQTQGTLL